MSKDSTQSHGDGIFLTYCWLRMNVDFLFAAAATETGVQIAVVVTVDVLWQHDSKPLRQRCIVTYSKQALYSTDKCIYSLVCDIK